MFSNQLLCMHVNSQKQIQSHTIRIRRTAGCLSLPYGSRTKVFSKSISSEILFEDNFNDFDETKWEIIQSEQLCKSKLNMII